MLTYSLQVLNDSGNEIGNEMEDTFDVHTNDEDTNEWTTFTDLNELVNIIPVLYLINQKSFKILWSHF